jgi:hypothetical protein
MESQNPKIVPKLIREQPARFVPISQKSLDSGIVGRTGTLDLGRLEKVRQMGGKILARCPACADEGHDRRGDHLVILPDGKFGCAAMPGDAEHRRRIFALAGIPCERERDPEEDRRWREQRARDCAREKQRAKLVNAAKTNRDAIIVRYAWEPADVWESSPQRIDCELVEFDPRHFIASLFASTDIVWTGEVHQSGSTAHASRWRTAKDWKEAGEDEQTGPMVSPATWHSETCSRAGGNVAGAPFVVLDFDGLDVPSALAIVRWLREGLGWQLAAILWTGNKSLHAWFITPAPDVLESLRVTALALGLDAGLIGRPEHPCRLPGVVHEKSGKRSRVLWLQCLPSTYPTAAYQTIYTAA